MISHRTMAGVICLSALATFLACAGSATTNYSFGDAGRDAGGGGGSSSGTGGGSNSGGSSSGGDDSGSGDDSGGGGSGAGSSGSGGSSSGGTGSSSGGSSGSGGGMADGTTGQPCSTDMDCQPSGGAGVNKCTDNGGTAAFQAGPLYPTPVCFLPTCEPMTDGHIHFCDGSDAPASPGICVPTTSPPQSGMGICLPKCSFGNDGTVPTGCQGKDMCNAVGFGLDMSNNLVGYGYCLGGCFADGDCPSGSHCQDGICLTTPYTFTKNVGDACTQSDATNHACDCIYDSTSAAGYCSHFCVTGDATHPCQAGYVCDAQEPTTLTGANDAAIAGFSEQNSGMAGSCWKGCGGDAGEAGACPSNSSCATRTVAGPDCVP